MSPVRVDVDYGHRQGFQMAPARVAQAGAPFLFGLAVEWLGAGALWISAGLGLMACLARMCMAMDLRS